MTPTHHPSDETLMRYAAGTLGEGPALVIGVHMSLSPASRARAETFEAIGGTMVEALAPSTMAPDAFATVLRKIDAPAPIPPRHIPPSAELVPGLAVPAPLRPYTIGPWRFLAPGLKVSRIKTGVLEKSKVLLLRAAPGAYLPAHGHGGDEYICVLKGSFSDQTGRYVPGDLAEADAALDHKPRVDSETECICLVSIEGGLRPHSLVGRLLQPLFGL